MITEIQRRKHREYMRVYVPLYRKRNKDRVRSFFRKAIRRPINRFSRAKLAAKYDGRCWRIPFDVYISLIKMPCHYCGGKLCSVGIALDRKNNLIGYTNKNVVPCCQSCNSRKNEHW